MDKKKKTRKPRSKGISGTYIHIKDMPNGLSVEKAQHYLKQHVHIWAEENFKHAVIVKVRVEEGSVKAWVLVGGITLFNFVGNYGSFRSGIDHIVSDAKAFSEYVIEQFKADERVPDEAVLRAEKRLGVPGKIQRFYKKLDKLQEQNNINEQQQLVRRLQKEFIEILELLDNERDRELFMEEIPNEVIQQPNVPMPDPIPGVINLAVIRNNEDWNA